jgi:squalene-hopene/tetraprenyl-beta-curcumene cyclase
MVAQTRFKSEPATAAAGEPAEAFESRLDRIIAEATAWLQRQQFEDGHWRFVLEADATIPAEYILFERYMGDVDDVISAKIASYLRDTQGDDGGWPLFHAGESDISATVKAYYALKMVGDDPEAPHMRRAREVVLALGGAERANVFTRILLALFGQVPWRAIPVMPVEIMLLPKWSPFHMNKISYWSRTTIAPLLILMALKPRARNPDGIGIPELFRTPPDRVKRYNTNPTGAAWGALFLAIDSVMQKVEPHFPKRLRQRAITAALDFIHPRLNGEDGIGAIFPPMVYSVMAFDAVGYPKDHPDVLLAKRAVRRLMLLSESGRAYMQPCMSPIWDTGLAAHALLTAGRGKDDPAVASALDWMAERQILDVQGDWALWRPALRPGGWAFQYANDYYPDVDDTAVVAMALHRADPARFRHAVDRATEWILGMQSKNGGWGAFDADNDHYYLNHIPFADHGALLDPPTADVSARCLSMLAQLGFTPGHPAVGRVLEYLKREQEEDGSWFGRWGTNYIYGTWSVLSALNAVGEDMEAPYVRRAVDWLIAHQRSDGGWGESGESYYADKRMAAKASTASQTAWAVLGLMAAGAVDHPAVRRGVAFLMNAPRQGGGGWEEEHYNAVGFPRVFYLKYHGYAAYFPLWALARYRNLSNSNTKRPRYGI